MVKNLPAMQETWVGSLGHEDPLEKEIAGGEEEEEGVRHGLLGLLGDPKN